MRTLLAIGTPDDEAADAVRGLARSAREADGVAPLSEQTLLDLRDDDADLTHVLAHDGDRGVVGYAQVDRRGEAATAEIVVAPGARRHGVGRILLRTAQRDATLPSRSGAPARREPLRVWAHGDLPPARALAQDAGLVAVRELLRLGLDLGDGPASHVPPPRLPDGLVLRAFSPGDDDDAWLALNARAFAQHPEQGRMTLGDLRARQDEDWFDPAGLLLLERTGERGGNGSHDAAAALVGSCWTKIPTDQPAGAREGEIYVVGIDPAAQGEGLGTLLTAAGLAHLAAAGCARAVLYVDGDNTPAVRTYERAGFGRDAVDVQYATPVTPSSPSGATMDR
ncbi:mycothiol synthase [Cellulomonas sp. PhB143]|uniref:mycothiol synthase n=1 Tax=Cellulomonas sp. PhB143 TaxID=2485186 RepID=UPI000F497BBA|nr:mycothiol synthase [Cellulomonas sp. PhB143]ROS76569.1 mycothiol synthase [Cellulomonas sp. PhB143]